MHTLVNKLLLKNKIPFDNSELKLQIESHPSYPSLHAITGVLDHFGVENMAFDIPQTQEVYNELPDFFIAHIKLTQGEELVFVEKRENQVVLTLPNKKKEKLSITQFLEQWTGIVVVVEKEELAKQNSISTDKLKLIPIILLGLSVAFLVVQAHSFSLYSGIQLLLAGIGTYIGYLLVKHDLGLNSEAVEKLCTQSEKTSCDAVLNSKGANIFGLFKLSDVTFVYFAGLSLFWLLSSITSISNTLIVTVSFLALPVVVYSVYYQASVVKKWCPLCLGTASILLSQIVVNWLNPFSFNFKLTDFSLLPMLIFSLLTIIYAFVKPLISKNTQLSKKEIDFYKFKRNFSLFNALHAQKPILDTKVENIEEIIFGNPNAKTELLAITNPLCGYCKSTHQAIDKLLVNNNKDLKVIIRFNVNTSNPGDLSYKIATALLNLYKKDITLCKEAMFQIYADGVDVNKWLAIYQEYTKPLQQEILETEKKWCVENNINFTPAIYLNQKEYPREYELIDINLFMDEIKEAQQVIERIPETLEVTTS